MNSDLVIQLSNPTARSVASAIIDALAAGRLADHDPLPSTRALSAQLGCSRGVVVRAYDELTAAGFIEAAAGSGTRVTAGAQQAAGRLVPDPPAANAGAPTAGAGAETRSDYGQQRSRALRPGIPDTTLINPADWRRAWRLATTEPIEELPPWESGQSPLAVTLREHLRRRRGIDTDRVLLAPGASAAIWAVASATRLAAVVEDPGYPQARSAFDAAGVSYSPCPVDESGLMVEQLGDQPRLVYTTPAHQYPLGVRMSLQRRADLLAWAQDTRSVIIEDDYDGEFRYGVAPLPALRSLPHARDVVAYIGTASKILSPSLQVAWLVLPPALQDQVTHELGHGRRGVAAMTAAATAAFIRTGALDRHIARAGRTYAARRRALMVGLRRHIPGVRLVGVEAGLHLHLELPPSTDNLITRALAQRGWYAEATSSYSLVAPHSGLLVGYGRLPETMADAAAYAIAEARAQVLRD